MAAQRRNTTFPSTRYQGSKAKIADWIISQIRDLKFTTCLDLFGGTGAIAYQLKKEGKIVTYNDLLRFNYYVGTALIQNDEILLSVKDIDWIIARHTHIEYPNFIEDTFKDVYFTGQENQWIDQVITNIQHLEDVYKQSLALFAIFQSCLIKRPFNLFHRKNLYLRLADVKRSFGNKTSWEKPFGFYFRRFAEEANRAIFCNGHKNRSLNYDALDVPGSYDLVYIDPPYMSRNQLKVNYLDYYHFLEGLANYSSWNEYIDNNTKNLRMKQLSHSWSDKTKIRDSFAKLFGRYQDNILVISYRSDGMPTEDELRSLLEPYKKKICIRRSGTYKYVLNCDTNLEEILVIAR